MAVTYKRMMDNFWSNYEERYKMPKNFGFKPLGAQVVIKVDAAAAKSTGGILIPDNVQGKATEGIVLAVGPGTIDSKGNRYPLEVQVGDKIMFGKWKGTELNVAGTHVLIMQESDILGIVDSFERISATG